MHLRPCHLESYLEEPLSKEPDNEELQGALRTCSILSKAISNAIFMSVINEDNEQDPYQIWCDIKIIYTTGAPERLGTGKPRRPRTGPPPQQYMAHTRAPCQVFRRHHAAVSRPHKNSNSLNSTSPDGSSQRKPVRFSTPTKRGTPHQRPYPRSTLSKRRASRCTAQARHPAAQTATHRVEQVHISHIMG
ncbi:hypothetical protein PTTG_25120 [Puccinia triticina 1-1 BBBD Race 1]|uniref:Uncharacterized protein n=1 Tax=Puccinia triticina (isolate 1-1 / race 1 (BBBD)) TaxID=630390 RepID=A0A180H4S7_PUCT1|nr:hypothetical protein PTTG_25120 [Puccinia triticina 1-1 BBBD Race 1]